MVEKYLKPNIALKTILKLTARPEGECEGGAQCDNKYLISNNTLIKSIVYESQKRGAATERWLKNT